MAVDVLAALSPQAVAAFYERLADGVDARKGKAPRLSNGNDADRDLLYSLHGFQLHSNVTVGGTLLPRPVSGKSPQKVRLTFQSFTTYARDVYDWDYSEHLTVPNPDFGSKAQSAVSPGSKTVVVYHKNAKRIEDAGLAAPFGFKTNAWQVTDAPLVSPSDVDPGRSL